MRIWLGIVLAMIVAMVVVGGTTRLTGSGLSMVEWRPLMGTLPPLDEHAWLQTFQRYQESPQYQQANHWMDLPAFKKIFFWEYLHRLLGRSVGLVTLLPWVWFLLRKRMTPSTAHRSFWALVFGGAQGLLGWFMVQSGLVDVPEVSHLRLAAHLGLAFFVGQWVLWLLLDLRASRYTKSPAPVLRRHAIAAWAFLVLLSVQITYGAFMAGTRAGWLFSSFPDMNGHFLPGHFFAGTSLLHDLFQNPSAIHWIHRNLAYGVLGAGIMLARAVARRTDDPRNDLRRGSKLLLFTLLIQFVLGAATVVFGIPTWLAVAHQVGAFALLSATLFVAHTLSRRPTAGR